MPLRTIDTRFHRMLERRHGSARPGRTLPRESDHAAHDGQAIAPTDRPFDDWPFDYEPGAHADEGGH